jgi:hypothetical protein
MSLKHSIKKALIQELIESTSDIIDYDEILSFDSPLLPYDPDRFKIFNDEYAKAFAELSGNIEIPNPFLDPDKFQAKLDTYVAEGALQELLQECHLDPESNDDIILSEKLKQQLSQISYD